MHGAVNTFALSGIISEPKYSVTKFGAPMVRFALYVQGVRAEDGTGSRNMGFHCAAFKTTVNYVKRLHKGDHVVVQGTLDSFMCTIADSALRYWKTNLVVDSVMRAFPWTMSEKQIVEEANQNDAVAAAKSDVPEGPVMEAEYVD